MSGQTAFWTAQLAECFEENAGKPKPGWSMSVGSPCFSRRSDASASRKESHFDPSGFRGGVRTDLAKSSPGGTAETLPRTHVLGYSQPSLRDSFGESSSHTPSEAPASIAV